MPSPSRQYSVSNGAVRSLSWMTSLLSIAMRLRFDYKGVVSYGQYTIQSMSAPPFILADLFLDEKREGQLAV